MPPKRTRSNASKALTNAGDPNGDRREPTPEGNVRTVGDDRISEEDPHDRSIRKDEPQHNPHRVDDVLDYLDKNREEFLKFLDKRNQPKQGGEKDYEASSASTRRRDRAESRRTYHKSPSPERYRDRRARDDHDEAHHEHRRRQQYDQDRAGGGFSKYGKIITPFSRRILDTPLPDRYKVPNIPPYDGLRDPEDFLSQYQYSMINQQLNHIHMCKLFPELLVGNARRWLYSLPPGSIGSYEDLMTAFHRRFFQKTASKTTSAHLLTIRQARGEPIQEFMTRFNKECLKVEDINDLLIISAFQNGILPGALYKKLVRHKPSTVTELWDIVDRFAEADEADRRKREAEKGEPAEKKKRDEDRKDKGQGRRSALDRLQRGPLESRLGPRRDTEGPRQDADRTQRNPLNKTRSEIYELNTDLFEKPKPMRSGPNQRSKKRYCAFHEDYGHDTEECRNLEADIEKLVRDGTLKKYQGRRTDSSTKSKGKRKRGQGRESCSDRTDKKARRDTDDDDDEPLVDGVVAAITGLPHTATKASLKSEARSQSAEEPTHKRFKADEVITFSDKDPVPNRVPHQDALIIQAVVANKMVHRVYVDSGASVSILFRDCFDKLGIEEEHLEPAPVPLRSFVQEETKSEGVIALPVTVGKAPTSSTKVVQFFVVKAYSPYNIILGRDWLNAVRAICSTYHLTIKIPTKGGIAVVRGDQRRAKECMQIALKKSTGASSQHNQA